MLMPFWGGDAEAPGDVNAGRFDRLAAEGRGFLELTPLESADVAVLPYAWEYVLGCDVRRERALAFAARAAAAGRPVVIFFASDSTEPVPVPNSIVFRTSLCASTRRPGEYALPAWSEDFVERYGAGRLALREYAALPVVGFCGCADPLRPSVWARTKPWLRRGLHSLGLLTAAASLPSGRTLRAAAMRYLAKSRAVRTNFVVHAQFWAGAADAWAAGVKEPMLAARLAYVRNLMDSDFVLCVRGSGNFSYRLYEALCCGRIPVFVNTDCVLPYDFAVGWRRHCVWVEGAELPAIATQVERFHRQLSPDGYQELQRSCRSLWEEWLSPHGFFRNFHRHFHLA